MSLEKSLEGNKARAHRYATEYKRLMTDIRRANREKDKASDELSRAKADMRTDERRIEHDPDNERLKGVMEKHRDRAEEAKRDLRRAEGEHDRLKQRAIHIYRWLAAHGARPKRKAK